MSMHILLSHFLIVWWRMYATESPPEELSDQAEIIGKTQAQNTVNTMLWQEEGCENLEFLRFNANYPTVLQCILRQVI